MRQLVLSNVSLMTILTTSFILYSFIHTWHTFGVYVTAGKKWQKYLQLRSNEVQKRYWLTNDSQNDRDQNDSVIQTLICFKSLNDSWTWEKDSLSQTLSQLMWEKWIMVMTERYTGSNTDSLNGNKWIYVIIKWFSDLNTDLNTDSLNVICHWKIQWSNLWLSKCLRNES